MKRCFQLRRRASHRGEQGYVLLTLLLIVALMAMALMITAPTLKFTMQRDREEEMIHRGVQYSNAIRRYYKKFGRYPTKIEDLESANNLRFLRKRYKDPMNCKAGTCQDFKLLYFSDVQSMVSGFGGGFGGGVIPGANPAGGVTGGLVNGPASAFGQSSAFGGNTGFGGNSGFGNSSSPFAQNQQAQNPQPPGNQPGGSDSAQSGDQTSTGQGAGSGTGGSSANPESGSSGSNQLGSGQIIGGPIVGVASATKIADPTIREFNHKKKYKDWLFIYDPAQDRGQLITKPYQQQMMGMGQGIPGATSVGGNSVGQPLPGMQNNPNLPGAGGFGNSNQSSSSQSSSSQQ